MRYRRLQQRLQEHRHAVRQEDSALADHAWEAHHLINWNSTTILDVLKQKLILETIHIKTGKNLLNMEDGLLPLMYNGLFRTTQQH